MALKEPSRHARTDRLDLVWDMGKARRKKVVFSRAWRHWALGALAALPVCGALIYFLSRPPQDRGESASRNDTLPKISLADITADSGITFRHINGARGDKLLPETMGGGGAFLDFDGDGLQDLFFVQSGNWPDSPMGTDRTARKPSQCVLMKNLGQGKFAPVENAAGAALPGFFGMGVAVGDFDNDGWSDLAVSGLGGVRLLHNEPAATGRQFVEITRESGLPYSPLPGGTYADFRKHAKPISFATSITWIDWDLDGKLDLAWGEYLTWSPAEDLAADARLAGTTLRAYAPPTAFSGAKVNLWRNRGSGRFLDSGPDSGLIVREKRDDKPQGVLVGKTLGILATDLDGDGWPDLLASNDMARNFLFHNQPGPSGTRHYVERGLETGFAYAEGPPRAGMGIDEGYYAPGHRAVVVVNYAGEPDSFFDLRSRNSRVGSAEGTSGFGFSEKARSVGIAIPSREWLKFGALFLDLDLDSHPDLLTTSGHLEPDIAQARKGQSYAQPPQFFHNDSQYPGKFQSWTSAHLGKAMFEPMVGRGCAQSDLNGDGRPGFVMFANGGEPRLMHAPSSENHWIRLVIQGDGTTTNRDAQGAMVKVEAEGKTQIFRVGGARSYLSQSELPLTVGLGKGTRVNKIEVRFPSLSQAIQTWTDLENGKTWRLEQGKPSATDISRK